MMVTQTVMPAQRRSTRKCRAWNGSGRVGRVGLPEVLLLLKNVSVILLKVVQSLQENPLVRESSVSMFLFFFWNRSHIDFRASAFASNPSLCTGFHGNYTWNRSQGFAPMRPGAHQEKKII